MPLTPNQRLSADHLIAKLQQSLPFYAFVTKRARTACASANERPVRNKQRIEITKVLDGANEGGIVCFASLNGGSDVLGISITHLRFDMGHPAYKEIRSYQIGRTKRLAAARTRITKRRNATDVTTEING